MSAFSTQLRANRPPIVLAQGEGSFTFRVEASDLWDAVRVVAKPETSVAEVKRTALAHFFPVQEYVEDYVLKFRGWEILDEGAALRDVGITEGSILLLAVRRRRPVR